MNEAPENDSSSVKGASQVAGKVAAVVAAVVAIDGPAGAGKSTVSRMLAKRLGYFLLDTGAIYRAVALVALETQTGLDDEAGLSQVAAGLHVEFSDGGAEQAVLVDGRDVSQAIRTPEISDAASRVSSLPGVRAALLELQRQIARRGGCVVEGRDIGTVVLPWAPVKFFVTASVEERAKRRHAELVSRGQPSDYEATAAEIRERDRRDETRALAPLKRAEDAELVDTSTLTIDEVVARLERVVRSRIE